jgi:uncharacterized membrane protein
MARNPVDETTMQIKLQSLYHRIRTSLWALPALMSIVALLLGIAGDYLDKHLKPGLAADYWLLYNGDLRGTQTLLTTIAGSTITVAGVVFSVTIVALSATSSQFGHRLLLDFMRDRGNQLVLGTFVATFVYCLVIMGAEPPPASGGSYRPISTSIGLLLSVASLGMLIYFFHHVALQLRAEHVIDMVAGRLSGGLERLFPNRDESSDTGSSVGKQGKTFEEKERDEGENLHFRSYRTGYIQAIDEDALLDIARDNDTLIRLPVRPGHFIAMGEAFALVQADKETADSLREQVGRHFVVGRMRTDQQDPEYGIFQLVELAVRALSPGINDPFSAITCIDWLGAIIAGIADRPLRSGERRDSEGHLRLITDPVTFDGLLAAAFNQIRQHSADQPAVALRLLEALARIARHTRRQERLAAVRRHADMVYGAATGKPLSDEDREAFEQRHRAVIQAIESS